MAKMQYSTGKVEHSHHQHEECSALEVFPARDRRSPDWFLENEHVIRPSLDKQDKLMTIRRIKNEWFQAKAAEIEQMVSRYRSAWKSIGQPQQASRGLRPSVPRVLKDENG